MIGQLKEVSSRQENAKRMTIFSGGSKYPPFYVHSALPSREAKGAFHLSELSGQTIPVVLRISLLIKTIQPDQSNPK